MSRSLRVITVFVALFAVVGAACGSDEAPEQRSFNPGDDTKRLELTEVVEGTGNEFSPVEDDEKMTKADFEAAGRQAKKQQWGVVKTTTQGPGPEPKANSVTVGGTDGTYYGTTSIYQYVNDDGSRPGVNCGQAAAATMIRYYGGYSGSDAVRKLDTSWSYGPDNAFGIFGSSPERVRYAIDANLSTKQAGWGTGESSMQSWIRAKKPVVVALDVAYLDGRWGGHYVVVFGYDNSAYYVTNYSHPSAGDYLIPKDQFRKAWANGVPWWAGVANKFIAVW